MSEAAAATGPAAPEVPDPADPAASGPASSEPAAGPATPGLTAAGHAAPPPLRAPPGEAPREATAQTPPRATSQTTAQATAQPAGDGARPNALPYVSFNQLRSFHAVAVAGTITAAAALLHVSQPTVTVQLRQLESHYGVELVRRTPRRVRLTELGESLFSITRQLFALESEAVELLNSAGSTLRGRLRVGGVAPYFVMRLLSAFNRTHPGVTLSLQLDNSATVVRRLTEQEIDVGIVGQSTLDSRLYALPYSRQDVVLFCRDDHPWAGRDGVRLGELADTALVLREKGSTCRLTLEQALQERGIAPRVTLEVCREGVREAVLAGFGVGITTDIEYVPDARTRMLRILDADIYTEAFAVCLRERRSFSVTRAFMATAEEFFDRDRAARRHAEHAADGAEPGGVESGDERHDGR